MSHPPKKNGGPSYELHIADGFLVVNHKFQSSMPEVLWRRPNKLRYGGRIKTEEPVGGFSKLPEGRMEFLRTNFYPDLPEEDELTPEQERMHHLKILGHRHMTNPPCANFTSFNVVWDLVEKMQPLFGETMNENVVILTPYNRQRYLYVNKLRESGKQGWTTGMLPQVTVVEEAVHRKWNVVILDYVVCTEKSLGFLNNKTRAFVMFTRMTAALIVVGSDIARAEWEAADADDSERAWSLTKRSSEASGRAFANGQLAFGNRRRENKAEPHIIDMLSECSRNGCCSDALPVSYHPLDPPQDILGSFDTGALKGFLHYLQTVRGLEVTSKEMLDTDTYAEYLEYRELYRSMTEKHFEAIKEGKLREFTGSVEGYETPEEVLRIERIKNKTDKDEVSPWSSPVVLPKNGTLSVDQGSSNNMASITNIVEKFSL